MKIFQRICLLATVCFINSIPHGAVAEDLDNRGILTFQAPLLISSKIGRYNACVRRGMELCNTTYDSCMMTVEEQIDQALQRCYDELMECIDSCDEDYATCCAPYEDRVCPKECKTKKTECYETCQDVGLQCQIDAVNFPYTPPQQDECFEDWNVCVEYRTDLCSTF